MSAEMLRTVYKYSWSDSESLISSKIKSSNFFGYTFEIRRENLQKRIRDSYRTFKTYGRCNSRFSGKKVKMQMKKVPRRY